MDKSIINRLERLERNGTVDGVTILAPAVDGHWELCGGLQGVYRSMEDGVRAYERGHRPGKSAPLIVIDV